MALPNGPSAPAAIQTARYLARPIELMEACRRRFGDVFTLRLVGGPKVFVSDPPTVKRILAGDRDNTPGSGRDQVFKPVLGPRSVFMLTGEEHQGRRRMIAPAVKAGQVTVEGDMIDWLVEQEIGDWPVGQPFPLHSGMRAITLEAILAAVFGFDPHDVRAEPIRRLSALTERSPAYKLAGSLTKRLRLPGPDRVFARTLGQVHEVLAAQIAARRDDAGAPGDDALSLLLAARDERGRGMSDAELRAQLLSLLMAGHLTTAASLAWCFDLLLNNQNALARVRAELEQASRGPYLEAVVRETLRIRPSVATVVRRLGTEIEAGGGQVLPGGGEIVIPLWLLHTHPDLFTDPYDFIPERYLDQGPRSPAWLPFGGGTRHCLGASFAMREIASVLRAVLSRVVLRSATGRPERIVRQGTTLAPRRGARVVVQGPTAGADRPSS